MVKLLDEPDKDLKCLAAETIGKKKQKHFILDKKIIFLLYTFSSCCQI
jgi:hypothetical protein